MPYKTHRSSGCRYVYLTELTEVPGTGNTRVNIRLKGVKKQQINWPNKCIQRMCTAIGIPHTLIHTILKHKMHCSPLFCCCCCLPRSFHGHKFTTQIKVLLQQNVAIILHTWYLVLNSFRNLASKGFPGGYSKSGCVRVHLENSEPTMLISQTTPDEHPTPQSCRWPALITLPTLAKFQLVLRRL